MKNNYVYILRCRDNSYYTGFTNDLEKRIESHNSGKGAKYTSSRLPVRYVFTAKCKDRSDALKKEHFIKTLNRDEKIKIINYEYDLDEKFNEYIEKNLQENS